MARGFRQARSSDYISGALKIPRLLRDKLDHPELLGIAADDAESLLASVKPLEWPAIKDVSCGVESLGAV